MRKAAPAARWARPENLHVTLKFIGETPQHKLDAIGEALASVRSTAAVGIQFRGLGFFPNQRRAKVLWAGGEASANLTALAADVDRAVASLGFERDTRAFTPHLTLARFSFPGTPPALAKLAASKVTHPFGMLRTGEFLLIQSKLKPSGAEYTTLRSFPFAAEA